jgi:putative FmdB family regulatory protein
VAAGARGRDPKDAVTCSHVARRVRVPIYEYECTPCRVIYDVLQSMTDPPLGACPRCRQPVIRLISAPNLNLVNCSSPTEAKYARMSPQEEIARERTLQRDYARIWLPPPVKHDPWSD